MLKLLFLCDPSSRATLRLFMCSNINPSPSYIAHPCPRWYPRKCSERFGNMEATVWRSPENLDSFGTLSVQILITIPPWRMTEQPTSRVLSEEASELDSRYPCLANISDKSFAKANHKDSISSCQMSPETFWSEYIYLLYWNTVLWVLSYPLEMMGFILQPLWNFGKKPFKLLHTAHLFTC